MKPKKVVLIVIDSLRADHLGCYGYREGTSQHIDDLASEGILFRHAFSPSPISISSIGSILTSKHPGNHSIGFTPNGKLDKDKDNVLPIILSEKDYETAAFTNSREFGEGTFGKSFEIYDQVEDHDKNKPGHFETNLQIFNWLEEHHDKDFFLFVHYSDLPHCQVSNPITDENYESIENKKDIGFYKAQYDRYVCNVDDNFKELMDRFKNLNIYDDSLIIFTSDHGMALGENNILFDSGLSVTLDQVAVPLLLKPQKNWKIKSGIIDIPVSTLDIMPTILSLYEKENVHMFEGHSLKNVLEGEEDKILKERTLVSENERQFALFHPDGLVEIKTKDVPISHYHPYSKTLLESLNGKRYYWKTGNEYIFELPFDQYQRYKIISDIINKFRTDKEIFKILDVGAGFEGNLKKFLPEDDIYFLDKDYPEEFKKKSNYIIGDIIYLNPEKNYDFVISIDTYEHINPSSREKYIHKLIDLSEIATIIAAPFDTPGVKDFEIFANEIYKISHGVIYRWLHEHIQNGLPSLPFTLESIKKTKFPFIVIPNGYLPRWFEMISTYLLIEGMPEFSKSMEELYEFYNKNFYDYDNLDPAYRHVILINKIKRHIDLSDIHSKDIQSADLSVLLNRLQLFISKIKELSINIRYKELLKNKDQVAELTKTLQTRDAQLAELSGATTAQIRELEAAINLKDNAIQEKNSQLTYLLSSKSWKWTAPLRWIHKGVTMLTNWRPIHPGEIWSSFKLDIKIYGIWGALNRIFKVMRESIKVRNVQRPSTIQIENFDNDWENYLFLSRKIEEMKKEKLINVCPRAPDIISINESELIAHAGSLEFQYTEKPQVSIIIPVYNNEKLTLECLESIKKNTKRVSYEIIVIDDGSGQKMQEIMSQIGNITYIMNPDNIGFLLSCNRASEKARGEFILFLNNDVQVMEDWLYPIVETFSKFENVGAVGPKVLYPNGHLQEAGALINRDISAKMIGLFDDPELQKYNYQREVIYCSGVCLTLPTRIFRELGGFDIVFAPGYYEDADLCFRLRKKGLSVFYNPESEIIHHLSATSNNIEGSYKQQCIIRNQQKFSERWQKQIDESNVIRLIAFYLPQYHTIPENDRWWGKGFTEWTNVTKARPNFEGHYQPRIPADLGYYDLRVEEVMEQQAELAKRYGIYGFCYYYYWFGGKRLLEMPLERMLETGKPNIPFCLCWANENWTRKWDGMNEKILIAQQHSDDDDCSVIRDIMRYMRHPNYIKINGKPLLLIYRISLFPDIRKTVTIWRDLCRKEGIGEIYLAMSESFEHADKNSQRDSVFDALVEFPPHNISAPIKPPGKLLNSDYKGIINDYREVILKYSLKEKPGKVRFRSIFPSWDNTSRRQNDSYIFVNESPGAYQAWLETVMELTHEQNLGEERIVFINAWNEWAEGNYLEPDRRFGHKFLEATRNAVERSLLKKE